MQIYAALVVFFFAVVLGFTQDSTAITPTPTTPTTSILIARTGVRTDEPHIGTYHYAEFFQLRGKWIVPDVGYIDFATNNYREVFIGGGRTLVDNKKLLVAEELYFDQALGPAAKHARYLQPWTLVQIHITPKVTSETVYFPYLPINYSARIQHVLERSKVEYKFGKVWKVGGGYAGYKFGNAPWQNKPMLTATVSTKAGSFETWLQKLPGGGQVQLRYLFAYTAKK